MRHIAHGEINKLRLYVGVDLRVRSDAVWRMGECRCVGLKASLGQFIPFN